MRKHQKNKWKYITALKEGFENFIGNEYFVDKFTMKKDKNTIYCLFFFSSHIRGYEKMLETKWEIDTEQGRGWEYDHGKMNLFTDLETNKLEDFITDFLQKEKRSNGKMYEFTLRRGFLPKHANQVLKKLQTNNRLELYKQDHSKARRGSFYIDYKSYKDDFNKLTIKLK